MKIFLKKNIRFLASRKLAVNLLAAAAVIAALTQIPFFLTKGLDRVVFSSWWYNGLLVVLLLNTLVCSLFRLEEMDGIPAEIPEEMAKSPNYRHIKSRATGQLMLFVKEHLSRKGYKIHDINLKHFMASKGTSYYWGSVLFHLSFLVILIGLILNNLFGFHGSIIVPVKQIVSEDHDSYQKIREGVLFDEQHQHFQIGLEDINVAFDRGKSTASLLEAKVWLMEGHRRLVGKQTVKPNQPLRYKGRRVLLTGFGYSPYFTLEHNNKIIFEKYVNLMTSSKKDGAIEFKDSFSIPNSKIKVDVQLFPHASISANGKLTSISNNLELPAIDVKVTHTNQKLFAGYAFAGQTIKLSNGMKLKFLGVQRYGWFDVAYNPGVYFLYGGFVLCLLGLMFALFVTPRRIWVTLGGNGVEISGSSKRYQQLFQVEFNVLVSWLSSEERVKEDK